MHASPSTRPTRRKRFVATLPPDKFQFVELVERGRPDWLASACRQGVRCDVLVISGHYDGGNEFFSDQLEAREFLPVDEMERVSCSDSCPGLFSQLKEVYLFGCNTLNPEALRSASAEIGRSLVRSGHSRGRCRAAGARTGRAARRKQPRPHAADLQGRAGDLRLFIGRAARADGAASILNRHFQTAGTGEVGSGRASARMLGAFCGHSMVVASGMSDADPQAAIGTTSASSPTIDCRLRRRLAFVHRLLNREMAEVRMFLDRIERIRGVAERNRAAGARGRAPALDEIARDQAARDRFLDFARDADQPAIRARMIELARNLGWLSPAEQRAEFMRMIGDEWRERR